MYEQSKKDIIMKLLNSNEPITSKNLAFSLGLSEKTTLKYVNFLKSELVDHGAAIDIKQRQGCQLVINDKIKFDNFLNSITNKASDDPESRALYVLSRLLLQKDYVDIYQLADEMYISPSTARNTIRSLQELIDKYDLKLIHSHTYGYMIKGKEADIRRCLAKEVTNNEKSREVLSSCQFKTDKMNRIYDIIDHNLSNYNISIGVEGINALTMHILIAINRIETHNEILIDKDAYVKVRTSPEFFLASSINKELTSSVDVTLSENELYYFTMHLSGKQRDFTHEQLKVNVSSEAVVFYNKFLRQIYKLTDVDLFEDKELKTSLLNHIVPFLIRVKNNNLITKSQLPNIKNEFPYAYELALYGLSFVNEIVLSEEEISYFALHIALSLEKNQDNANVVNIAVVAKEIASVYRILSFRLDKFFNNYINSIKYFNSAQLESTDFSSFSLILDCSESNYDFKKPTLTINPFLSEDDVSNVSALLNKIVSKEDITALIKPELFFEIEARNKEDALIQQIELIRKYYDLPADFYLNIMKREVMAATETNVKIAYPHPLTNDVMLPTFVSVAHLTKPIMWHKKPVQLLFLICTHDSKSITRAFFGKIAKLSSNEKAAQQLIYETDFEKFIKIYEQV